MRTFLKALLTLLVVLLTLIGLNELAPWSAAQSDFVIVVPVIAVLLSGTAGFVIFGLWKKEIERCVERMRL